MVLREKVYGNQKKAFVNVTRFFSYVLSRDYGFAPNPFNGICTLATCKPKIRAAANIGDWIFGTSSTAGGKQSRLIYAMKVAEKISFNEYWQDPRFETKKPIMNGSLKKMYGDNIYHNDGMEWHQANSHHSLEDGSPNPKNVKKDTSVDRVLVSFEFYYFGGQSMKLHKKFILHIAKKGPGHRCPDEKWGSKLTAYISAKYEMGYYADPALFSQFERYDGTS